MRRKISILLAVVMAVTIWSIPGGGAFATQEDGLKISLSNASDIVYDGEAQEPEIVVTDSDGNDVDIDDCDVKYSDNVNAGTAKVEVKYGDEEGSAEFEIERAELNQENTVVTVDPDITVRYEGEELSEGKDYEVVYEDSDADKAGKFKVNGVGNFTGSVLKEGEEADKPATVQGLKADKQGVRFITLSWDKNEDDIDGYKVCKYATSKTDSSKKVYYLLKDIKNSNTTTFKVEDLSPATNYTFAVRAYRNDDGVYNPGTYSEKLTVSTKPSKSVLSKLTVKPNKTITATWKKRNGTGFEVQIAGSTSEFSEDNIKDVGKTTSHVFKGCAGGKTYYVRVRAYKKSGDDTLYGEWSKVKSAKAKSRGWVTDSKGLKYYYYKGEKVTGEQTLTSDKTKFKYYYFDSNGVFRGFSAEGWKKINGSSSNRKYAVCVSRSLCRYVIYKKISGKWAPIRYGLCGPGRKAHKTPTFNTLSCGTLGKWLQEKRVHFGDPDGYRCWYFTRVKNTIGFHSVKYRVGSKTRLQKPLYEQIGRTVSHGCIRLSMSDAIWVYKNIFKGTRVIVVDDDTKESRSKVTTP